MTKLQQLHAIGIGSQRVASGASPVPTWTQSGTPAQGWAVFAFA
jgi:hypothetical protein